MKGEGVGVDLAGRHVGVVLVRLHGTEPSGLALEAGQGVDGELGAGHGVLAVKGEVEVVTAVLGFFVLQHPDKFDGRMVEVQVGTDIVAGVVAHAGPSLGLVHQLGEFLVVEAVTLVKVQVDVLGIEVSVQVAVGDGGSGILVDDVHGLGYLDELGQLFERYVVSDGVELKSDKRQSATGSTVVVEDERNVETHTFGRLGDAFFTRSVLADHFTETLAGLTGQFLECVHVRRVDGINLLAADSEGHATNKHVADFVDPVDGGRSIGVAVDDVAAAGIFDVFAVLILLDHDRWQFSDQVLLVDKVTGTVQGKLLLAAVHAVAVEGLADGFKGEVGATVHLQFPEGDFGFGGKCGIAVTDANKLCEGAAGADTASD